LQERKFLDESKLKILEEENKKAEQHFNELIAEKNEVKVNLERKLGEARNLQKKVDWVVGIKNDKLVKDWG
jgi:hypothetical protein